MRAMSLCGAYWAVEPSVDRHDGAGHEPRFVGGQEGDDVGYLVGRPLSALRHHQVHERQQGGLPSGCLDRGIVEWCVDPARADHVDAHPLARVVERHLAREHQDAALARAVRGDRGLPDQPGGRAHVDDRPAAIRDHHRNHVSRGEERSGQVHGQGAVPVGQGRLRDGPGHEDARTGEQDVDPAVLRRDLCNQRRHACIRCNIDCDAESLGPTLAQGGGDLAGPCAVPVRHDDGRAVGREPARGCCTDGPGAARDECDLAGRSAHAFLPLRPAMVTSRRGAALDSVDVVDPSRRLR